MRRCAAICKSKTIQDQEQQAPSTLSSTSGIMFASGVDGETTAVLSVTLTLGETADMLVRSWQQVSMCTVHSRKRGHVQTA